MGDLGTTREHADAILGLLLDAPASWTTPELHLEIETYTWSILEEAGSVVDGLEREYGHLLGLLRGAGWSRIDEP